MCIPKSRSNTARTWAAMPASTRHGMDRESQRHIKTHSTLQKDPSMKKGAAGSIKHPPSIFMQREETRMHTGARGGPTFARCAKSACRRPRKTSIRATASTRFVSSATSGRWTRKSASAPTASSTTTGRGSKSTSRAGSPRLVLVRRRRTKRRCQPMAVLARRRLLLLLLQHQIAKTPPARAACHNIKSNRSLSLQLRRIISRRPRHQSPKMQRCETWRRRKSRRRKNKR